jgi:hypothetical protein
MFRAMRIADSAFSEPGGSQTLPVAAALNAMANSINAREPVHAAMIVSASGTIVE